MKARILSRMVLLGISREELAAAMRMSLSTLSRRLSRPDDFTVGEMRKVAKKLHVSLDELLKEGT